MQRQRPGTADERQNSAAEAATRVAVRALGMGAYHSAHR